MIHPFALADILLVYRLQNDGVPLAIEHILSHPRPPLWLALTAPWPWAGRGVATYVLKERSQGRQQMRGFVQLLKRAARPEADLLHMAPFAVPLLRRSSAAWVTAGVCQCSRRRARDGLVEGCRIQP